MQEDQVAPVNRRYCSTTFVDTDIDEQTVLGEWRNVIPSDTALGPVTELGRRMRTRNSTQNATTNRNFLK